ncbi:uncharacterized protein G2W53_043543 [Senna tora]|uniref:Uncharacterized protein n=1 Tax=Senna tora TaxID=362788 RepID=A0A834SIX5_9FABA|nr:uncharacterized protein G2W53_043543 [Senna tora]
MREMLRKLNSPLASALASFSFHPSGAKITEMTKH